MSERQMRVRLGLFVLAMMVAFGTLVILFGAFPTMFKGGTPYTIVFADAPGAAPGMPVRRSGVRIGEVRSVALDEETGQVRVGILIDPPYRVRRNETPTLVMGLLGSDASIDFVPQPPVEGQPPPDRSPVPPNSELAGTRAATVGTLLSRASDVVPSTQETLNDLRRSMQRLEKMAPLMEETLREYRDLARIGRDLVPDLRRTNTEVADLARAAREALPEARRAAEDAGAASRNVAKLAERADVLLQANQDKLVKAVDNFNDAATRAAAMLSEENQKNVNAIVRNTRRASDRFESIANNVDEASKEGKEAVKEGRKAGERLNRLLNQVEEILQTLSATTRPLGERGPRMVQNADELLEKLNRSAGDFTSLLGVLDRSDGTFRRFLTDPTVYNRLDDVLCGVQRALPRVDRILRDFETFADKLARHPEAIGLGGVVRPGSGLKEPPTPPGVYRPMH